MVMVVYGPCHVDFDREWHEPVYVQLAWILRDRIRGGELEPGRPVPSLRTLVETYGVNRGDRGEGHQATR